MNKFVIIGFLILFLTIIFYQRKQTKIIQKAMSTLISMSTNTILNEMNNPNFKNTKYDLKFMVDYKEPR